MPANITVHLRYVGDVDIRMYFAKSEKQNKHLANKSTKIGLRKQRKTRTKMTTRNGVTPAADKQITLQWLSSPQLEWRPSLRKQAPHYSLSRSSRLRGLPTMLSKETSLAAAVGDTGRLSGSTSCHRGGDAGSPLSLSQASDAGSSSSSA